MAVVHFLLCFTPPNSFIKNMPRNLTIDIHGKYVEDALAEVREFVRRAPKEAEKIIVIHGYNRGTALRDALRTRLRSPRIRLIEPSFFNQGETYIWLKR